MNFLLFFLFLFPQLSQARLTCKSLVSKDFEPDHVLSLDAIREQELQEGGEGIYNEGPYQGLEDFLAYDPEQTENYLELVAILKKYVPGKDQERNWQMIQMYFLEGKKLEQIAGHFGITRQRVAHFTGEVKQAFIKEYLRRTESVEDKVVGFKRHQALAAFRQFFKRFKEDLDSEILPHVVDSNGKIRSENSRLVLSIGQLLSPLKEEAEALAHIVDLDVLSTKKERLKHKAIKDIRDFLEYNGALIFFPSRQWSHRISEDKLEENRRKQIEHMMSRVHEQLDGI